MPPAVPRITLTCEHCGTTYSRMECEMRSRPSRFCSKTCFYAAKRKGTELVCDGCGQGFYRKPSEVTVSNFCSRDCYDESRRRTATSYPKVGGRHEHRAVAERKLGRPLRPGEIVHHVDGNRRNNSDENIEVLSGQSEHARLHNTGRRRRRDVTAPAPTLA